MAAPTSLPDFVDRTYHEWSRVLVYAPYFAATWKLSRSGETHFAKVARSGHYPSLADERDRMAWAGPHLPVPEIIDYGVDEGVEWLITRALPGRDATHPEEKRDEEAVVRALGEGLRRFHEAPVDDCPFDFRLDAALAHCTARVVAGTHTWDDLHDEFKDHTPQTALDELLATRPSSEDLVVCHGDYCFPNMLLQDGRVTGYLDLGELGVADRWWDIAVGGWSVTWNVDPSWEPAFYEAYGVEPDPERIRFYRLMYDLAS